MGNTLLKKQRENKMNSNMTQYLALEKKFTQYGEKFKFWNGMEFGIIIAMILTIPDTTRYLIAVGCWLIATVFAAIYLHKTKKIIEEMEKIA